mmetsp:Transcript_2585/g.4160  ORF Transcript_2585/g.4160 Transcript_2585/m.4160 type:complete len:160 (+) Transcript_2585:1870-2349(+)
MGDHGVEEYRKKTWVWRGQRTQGGSTRADTFVSLQGPKASFKSKLKNGSPGLEGCVNQGWTQRIIRLNAFMELTHQLMLSLDRQSQLTSLLCSHHVRALGFGLGKRHRQLLACYLGPHLLWFVDIRVATHLTFILNSKARRRCSIVPASPLLAEGQPSP